MGCLALIHPLSMFVVTVVGRISGYLPAYNHHPLQGHCSVPTLLGSTSAVVLCRPDLGESLAAVVRWQAGWGTVDRINQHTHGMTSGQGRAACSHLNQSDAC